jgi:ketosteroid isomerase-like protein
MVPMHGGSRSALAAALFVSIAFATACSKDDDGAASAATADSTPATAAPTAPAELVAAGDAFKAGWNTEDDAAMAAMFTDSAMVQEDTAHYMGRSEIQQKWIKPSMAVIDQLTITDDAWTPSGADFTSHGRYSLNGKMDKKPFTQTGVYDNTWTKGADGSWKISTMTLHSDPPATTTTAQ